MPFLKDKIRLIFTAKDIEEMEDYENKDLSSPVSTLPSDSSDFSPSSVHKKQRKISKKKSKKARSSPESHSKNIVKNYGKALCAFASSKVAIPYLEVLFQKENLCKTKIPCFIEFFKKRKREIKSIENLRKLLMRTDDDDSVTEIYKRIFQEISVIFLKYFCVNWIFSGRLFHKKAHLLYRFKMLRRIQNPEHFTYLKTVIK